MKQGNETNMLISVTQKAGNETISRARFI